MKKRSGMKNPCVNLPALILFGFALAACQPTPITPTATPEPTLTPTEIPEPWQLVSEGTAPLLITLVGFNDSAFGIAVGGDVNRVLYSEDGGAAWKDSQVEAQALFGLDIVDQNIAWTCGNRTVRFTTDGGKTWQEAANFGNMHPDHCRFISFMDATTGWAATTTALGATSDGGASWTTLPLPEGLDQIAAISLYASGSGCLLSADGVLYSTGDNGSTWTQFGAIDLGGAEIARMNPPVAAMRFQDADHGLVVIPMVKDNSSRVYAFSTSDGGKSGQRSTVAETFGFPVISHDGRFLTLFSQPNKVMVFQYNGG